MIDTVLTFSCQC